MGTEPRILHIDTGSSWRGGQQQAAYLIEGLKARDYFTAMVCQPASVLETFCLTNDITYFPARMMGELDFSAAIRIASICKKHGYNILHLHEAHAVTLGLMAKFLVPSLRLIAVRRVNLSVNRHLLSRWKYGTHRLDCIVCVSEAIRRTMIADGLPEDKLRTIHSGVDFNRFVDVSESDDTLRSELGIPADHLVVGTIAAMDRLKDYPTLLKAAQKVLASENRVTFVAVGDGPFRDSAIKVYEELQLGSRFIFTGFREDIRLFLRLFDTFVFAPRNEGLGTSLVDALACGLPVVATDVGGIPEIVIHEENGLLVPPLDPSALAAALLRVIREDDLRMSLAGRARISVQPFNIRATIERNINLYREHLA